MDVGQKSASCHALLGTLKASQRSKKIVNHCNTLGVKYLTVFAFGRENWNRPQGEVSFLMRLMIKRLDKELAELHQKKCADSLYW